MSEGEGASDGRVVLGLSFDFHDAAAAIVVDGEIVAAAEEERFSRIKHDAAMPEQAVVACLELAGVRAADVDHVVFYEKPLAVASRFLASKQREGPRSARSFLRDGPAVFGKNLMVGYRVAKMLTRLGAANPPQLQFVEHHLSHAAAAFLPSPFEHAGILTVDGLGEWATAVVGHGTNHRITLLDELRYPDSVGLVYSFVTAYCGFRPNDDEYKLMGLAPYGTPRLVEELESLVRPFADGSLAVDAKALRWYGTRGLRTGAIAELLDGPPSEVGAEPGQREADLAASVQLLTERAVTKMATRVREMTQEPRLCLAGGVALNCVANGRLLADGVVDELWVQPAAGDAGSAVGAALAYWHLVLDQPRVVDDTNDSMSGAFLGPSIGGPGVVDEIAALGLEFEEVADDDELARIVAARLADGAIVGWARGRMEFGPRALGHRSLLADPRSTSVRQRLNLLTKGREGFRPFAPAVLADRADEWFDLHQPSPYMLIVAPVLDARRVDVETEPSDLGDRAVVPRSTIPACTHVDGSARIQTVAVDTNPDLHRLLAAFDDATGCPVLVNTSFNRAGEPIVASVADAVATARSAQIDLLVVGNVLIEGSALAGADASVA